MGVGEEEGKGEGGGGGSKGGVRRGWGPLLQV